VAVYVDQIIDYGDAVKSRLGHSKWCHMTADTQPELHEAAEAIGLRRAWFQNKDGITWHYDIVPSKRALAIRNGAISVDYTKMAELIGSRRAEAKMAKNEEQPDAEIGG
jgi:hypothetical protein